MPLLVMHASANADSGGVRQTANTNSEADLKEEEEFLPHDHPAYDRVPTQPESGAKPGSFRWRTIAGVLILLGLMAGSYILVRALKPDEAETPDLLELAAASAAGVQLDLATDDLDEAEDFVLGEFGWPIRVPVLADSRLMGVGVDEVTEGVELPVLQYATEESAIITVYVYDYAFLDAAVGRLSLAPAVFAHLAQDDGVDVRRVDEFYLVLWRRRAVIFTAVTRAEPARIVEGLRLGR